MVLDLTQKNAMSTELDWQKFIIGIYEKMAQTFVQNK
jgi:hypothetical protein